MSNTDIKMSECCTCGTKWQTGQDGSHSCSSKLSNDNQALVEQNKALKVALVDLLQGDKHEYLTKIAIVRNARKALEQNKY